ncbi:hypothetical protein J6590_005986 [Homalodisca vitripennis]|nr:hypothetical protein J6590_005986 [Homalodisca vitripennis]
MQDNKESNKRLIGSKVSKGQYFTLSPPDRATVMGCDVGRQPSYDELLLNFTFLSFLQFDPFANAAEPRYRSNTSRE